MSVPELLADARKYTGELVDQAQKAMATAISDVERVGYTLPNLVAINGPREPKGAPDLVAPTLSDIALDLPNDPDPPGQYQDIAPLDAGTAPEFAIDAPEFEAPTKPAELALFLDRPPEINTNIEFPQPPSALTNPFIESPVLVDRMEPDKPQVMLPSFDAVMPTDNTVAPTDLDVKFASAYRDAAPSTIAMLDGYVDNQLAKLNPEFHSQMASIEAQLKKYLDGGTGLSPAAENAIYERAKGKNSADSQRVRNATYAEAAARGFTMPPGFAMSAIQQARQAGADNNARAAAEIVTMQAEMEQKNLQFAVTTSTALRSTMVSAALNYHQNLITINGQALDYAKNILSAILETYNTAVKVYSLKLDGYKAEASVYEVKLKSSLAGIELYQAEIKALEALTSVDKAKVGVYRARIDSLSALANVYRAQIDAVQGRVSLEKVKLDVFQTRVQTFSAQVQAKNAEWQGYSAAINGEQAKAQLFQSQVGVFNAKVQAYRALIDGKSEVVKATATTNDARARQYSAALSGYSAVVQAKGEKAKTQLENQRQDVVAFQAKSQAQIANAQITQEYYRSATLIATENAKLRFNAQVQQSAANRGYGDTIARLGTANATISANLAGAAMSGMNALTVETLNKN